MEADEESDSSEDFEESQYVRTNDSENSSPKKTGHINTPRNGNNAQKNNASGHDNRERRDDTFENTPSTSTGENCKHCGKNFENMCKMIEHLYAVLNEKNSNSKLNETTDEEPCDNVQDENLTNGKKNFTSGRTNDDNNFHDEEGTISKEKQKNNNRKRKADEPNENHSEEEDKEIDHLQGLPRVVIRTPLTKQRERKFVVKYRCTLCSHRVMLSSYYATTKHRHENHPEYAGASIFNKVFVPAEKPKTPLKTKIDVVKVDGLNKIIIPTDLSQISNNESFEDNCTANFVANPSQEQSHNNRYLCTICDKIVFKNDTKSHRKTHLGLKKGENVLTKISVSRNLSKMKERFNDCYSSKNSSVSHTNTEIIRRRKHNDDPDETGKKRKLSQNPGLKKGDAEGKEGDENAELSPLIYQCGHCEIHFTSFKIITDHWKTCRKDVTDSVNCEKCGLTFFSTELATHSVHHHRNNRSPTFKVVQLTSNEQLRKPIKDPTSKKESTTIKEHSSSAKEASASVEKASSAAKNDPTTANKEASTANTVSSSEKEHPNNAKKYFITTKKVSTTVNIKPSTVNKDATHGKEYLSITSNVSTNPKKDSSSKKDSRVSKKHSNTTKIIHETTKEVIGTVVASLFKGFTKTTLNAKYKNSKVKLYKCKICLVHFISCKLLRSHKKRKLHNQTKTPCPKCQYLFCVDTIHRHIIKHHTTRDLQRNDFLVVTEEDISDESSDESSDHDDDDGDDDVNDDLPSSNTDVSEENDNNPIDRDGGSTSSSYNSDTDDGDSSLVGNKGRCVGNDNKGSALQENRHQSKEAKGNPNSSRLVTGIVVENHNQKKNKPQYDIETNKNTETVPQNIRFNISDMENNEQNSNNDNSETIIGSESSVTDDGNSSQHENTDQDSDQEEWEPTNKNTDLPPAMKMQSSSKRQSKHCFRRCAKCFKIKRISDNSQERICTKCKNLADLAGSNPAFRPTLYKKIPKLGDKDIYKCDNCDLHFTKLTPLLREHAHPSYIKIRCHECGLHFSDSCIAYHKKFHHRKLNLNKADFNIILSSDVNRGYNTGNNDVRQCNMNSVGEVEKNRQKQPNNSINREDRKLYKCIICKLFFITRSTWSYHMYINQHNPKSKNKCTICNITFSKRSLFLHKRKHHDQLKLSRKDFLVITGSNTLNKLDENVEKLSGVPITNSQDTYLNNTPRIDDEICEGNYNVESAPQEIRVNPEIPILVAETSVEIHNHETNQPQYKTNNKTEVFPQITCLNTSGTENNEQNSNNDNKGTISGSDSSEPDDCDTSQHENTDQDSDQEEWEPTNNTDLPPAMKMQSSSKRQNEHCFRRCPKCFKIKRILGNSQERICTTCKNLATAAASNLVTSPTTSYKKIPKLGDKDIYKCDNCDLHFTKLTPLLREHAHPSYIKIRCHECGLHFSDSCIAYHKNFHHKKLNLNHADFNIILSSEVTRRNNTDNHVEHLHNMKSVGEVDQVRQKQSIIKLRQSNIETENNFTSARENIEQFGNLNIDMDNSRMNTIDQNAEINTSQYNYKKEDDTPLSSNTEELDYQENNNNWHLNVQIVDTQTDSTTNSSTRLKKSNVCETEVINSIQYSQENIDKPEQYERVIEDIDVRETVNYDHNKPNPGNEIEHLSKLHDKSDDKSFSTRTENGTRIEDEDTLCWWDGRTDNINTENTNLITLQNTDESEIGRSLSETISGYEGGSQKLKNNEEGNEKVVQGEFVQTLLLTSNERVDINIEENHCNEISIKTVENENRGIYIYDCNTVKDFYRNQQINYKTNVLETKHLPSDSIKQMGTKQDTIKLSSKTILSQGGNAIENLGNLHNGAVDTDEESECSQGNPESESVEKIALYLEKSNLRRIDNLLTSTTYNDVKTADKETGAEDIRKLLESPNKLSEEMSETFENKDTDDTEKRRTHEINKSIQHRQNDELGTKTHISTTYNDVKTADKETAAEDIRKLLESPKKLSEEMSETFENKDTDDTEKRRTREINKSIQHRQNDELGTKTHIGFDTENPKNRQAYFKSGLTSTGLLGMDISQCITDNEKNNHVSASCMTPESNKFAKVDTNSEEGNGETVVACSELQVVNRIINDKKGVDSKTKAISDGAGSVDHQKLIERDQIKDKEKKPRSIEQIVQGLKTKNLNLENKEVADKTYRNNDRKENNLLSETNLKSVLTEKYTEKYPEEVMESNKENNSLENEQIQNVIVCANTEMVNHITENGSDGVLKEIIKKFKHSTVTQTPNKQEVRNNNDTKKNEKESIKLNVSHSTKIGNPSNNTDHIKMNAKDTARTSEVSSFYFQGPDNKHNNIHKLPMEVIQAIKSNEILEESIVNKSHDLEKTNVEFKACSDGDKQKKDSEYIINTLATFIINEGSEETNVINRIEQEETDIRSGDCIETDNRKKENTDSNCLPEAPAVVVNDKIPEESIKNITPDLSNISPILEFFNISAVPAKSNNKIIEKITNFPYENLSTAVDKLNNEEADNSVKAVIQNSLYEGTLKVVDEGIPTTDDEDDDIIYNGTISNLVVIEDSDTDENSRDSRVVKIVHDGAQNWQPRRKRQMNKQTDIREYFETPTNSQIKKEIKEELVTVKKEVHKHIGENTSNYADVLIDLDSDSENDVAIVMVKKENTAEPSKQNKNNEIKFAETIVLDSDEE